MSGPLVLGAAGESTTTHPATRGPSAANDSWAFISDDLDGMHSGTVELSVPLLGGVIQIGAAGAFEVGRIRVSKSPTAVTVRQVDGRPMQVEIVTETGRLTDAGHYQTTKSMVFEEPVEVLRLKRMVDTVGRAVWCAAGPVNVTRHEHLKQFADTVGRFGSAKQRKVSGKWDPPVLQTSIPA